MNPDPTPATGYALGVTLLTKDGRQIGNAIIIGMAGHTRYMLRKEGRLTGIVQPVWEIQTDFGNRTKLSETELNSMFTLGFEYSYEEWRADQLEIMGRREKPCPTDQSSTS